MRRKRHIQCAAQIADSKVIGSEIMAPLTDAMRLIDGDQPDPRAAQHSHGPTRGQPFRRHIEKLPSTIFKPLPYCIRFLFAIARGQRTRRHACRLQGPNLIAHQGCRRCGRAPHLRNT